MDFDFTPYFERYERIAAEVDAVFDTVAKQHPDKVNCRQGCCDCCHALFDLSLIEALYLNAKFNEIYAGQERSDILDRADEADRATYKIKREVFQASQDGRPVAEIMDMVGKAKVRCALLNKADGCDLYEHRPLTCRLYGIPTAINGQGHCCGLSGFEAGEPYPTVHVEKLQDRLMALSQELVENMPTQHVRMADVLVPVSMALQTTYDEEYMGIVDEATAARIRAKAEETAQAVEEAVAASGQASGQAPGQAAAKAFDCNSCGQEKGSSACDSCSGTTTWELGKAKPGGGR